MAGVYGWVNLEKGVAAEKESKGVEVGGVQLLQGERVGSQEWRAIMAGQTGRENRGMQEGQGEKGKDKS